MVLFGKGNAMNKVVSVVEIVKRKCPKNIVQETDIDSIKTIDTWKSLGENNSDK